MMWAADRARTHDPRAAHLVVVRNAQRRRRGARHRDRHVRPNGGRVLALPRVEHRTEFRLHARAGLLHLGQRRFARRAIGDLRFVDLVLLDALEIADARALRRDRLLAGIAGLVVAHQPVGAGTERVVRAVRLPLDDHCAVAHVAPEPRPAPHRSYPPGFVRTRRPRAPARQCLQELLVSLNDPPGQGKHTKLIRSDATHESSFRAFPYRPFARR